MKLTQRLTRTATAITVAALTATGLGIAAAPAQAASVFSELTLTHRSGMNIDSFGSGCNWSSLSGTVPADIPLTENTEKTSNYTLGIVGFVPSKPSDNLTATAHVTGTAKATTANGLPRTVRLEYSGKAQTVASQGASTGCRATPSAEISAYFKFTTTTPMWATLSYRSAGGSYAQASLSGGKDPGNAGSYGDLYEWTTKGSGSSTIYIPTGNYSGNVLGAPSLTDQSAQTLIYNSSGAVQISFAPVGSALTAPSGSAQSYARLGQARSCATHTLPAALTSDSARIKKISRVSFSVNGKTVKSLKGTSIKRGLAIKLPIADSVKASVKTTVTLKNGDKRTATASYRACA